MRMATNRDRGRRDRWESAHILENVTVESNLICFVFQGQFLLCNTVPLPTPTRPPSGFTCRIRASTLRRRIDDLRGHSPLHSMGNGQSSRSAAKADEAPSAIPRRRRRATGCWILKMCSSKQRRSIREHKKPEDDGLKLPPPAPPLPPEETHSEAPPEEVRFRIETPQRTPPRPPTSLPLRQLSINNSIEKDLSPTPLTPSLPASTVLCSWKNRSLVLRPSGDSAFGDSITSTCSVDTSEVTTPSTAAFDHGGLSLHSYESLMQIIRCFPFPSPKNSPRSAKRLNRTMSDDEAPCGGERGAPLTPSGVSLHQNMVVGSGRPSSHWNGAKRQIGHSIANVLHRYSSRRDSAAGDSPVTSPIESRKDFRIEKRASQGALGKLCQVSVDTMAITALPLDCWLKERLKNWVQLSGHEGTIVPATNHTLWKKQPNEKEAIAYKEIMADLALKGMTPRFFKQIEHKNESFIEIQDLLSQFPDVHSRAVMDIKIGTRTFLECEVKNALKRSDLYQKMVAIDPEAPSEAERAEGAITKLRYMQFREQESSTASLGFRIEAAQMPGGKTQKNFKKVKTAQQVGDTLWTFFGARAPEISHSLVLRLREMRKSVENSEFFRSHEVVGSSILIIYDDQKASAWMIDFAKSTRVPSELSLDHRTQWEVGNHEDGYLFGLDNLISILESLDASCR
ncbi:hypothetical protein QR680_009686 [Steinernema hermaphroditum]|uniref:Kinase n=1 Tax=Steinernema hermaphroditum TaxID=289476 RepID=A0AA39M9X1_9BILA|nr:hypothetical protein QR680_009686 [Steinernema hermaphroditum]